MADSLPPPTFDAANAVLRIATIFKTGAICPAMLWEQLAEAITNGDGDVHAILNTLPPELQNELRDAYRDRPISFWVLRGNPLRRQFKNWCRCVGSNG